MDMYCDNFTITDSDRPRDSHLSAILVPTSADRGCRVVSATDPHGRILFLDGSRYYFLQVAPQLYSWGWVDPVYHLSTEFNKN
jgi:hypothetical protein